MDLKVRDGERIEIGQSFASVKGRFPSLLQGERVVLKFCAKNERDRDANK